MIPLFNSDILYLLLLITPYVIIRNNTCIVNHFHNLVYFLQFKHIFVWKCHHTYSEVINALLLLFDVFMRPVILCFNSNGEPSKLFQILFLCNKSFIVSF